MKRRERVVLYQAAWSPECRIARRFLDKLGIELEVVEVAASTPAERELQEATGSRRVPVLRVGEDWIQLCTPEGLFSPGEASIRLGVRPIPGSGREEARE